MTPSLNYPVYVIASRDGVVIVKTDGHECIMLFHARALADREIEKIQSSHPQLTPLRALPVSNSDALREGLKGLPVDVACVVWDATGKTMARVSLDELLRAL